MWKLNENPTPTARAGEIYRHRPAASNIREGAGRVLRRNIRACKCLNGRGFCAGRAGKVRLLAGFLPLSGDNCHGLRLVARELAQKRRG
ncbi:hypothetical protein GLE_4309 [Lysobacter enzymogenes]|uniref:Uncharacterized protein n=1 Tax=Lysobacter enzymogenes TaxID=69 RepID=A0A0S2DMB6_LYSEN|nr:hypothetical protein GLE_4309 [Lysobacter enzymogenes]